MPTRNSIGQKSPLYWLLTMDCKIFFLLKFQNTEMNPMKRISAIPKIIYKIHKIQLNFYCNYQTSKFYIGTFPQDIRILQHMINGGLSWKFTFLSEEENWSLKAEKKNYVW